VPGSPQRVEGSDRGVRGRLPSTRQARRASRTSSVERPLAGHCAGWTSDAPHGGARAGGIVSVRCRCCTRRDRRCRRAERFVCGASVRCHRQHLLREPVHRRWTECDRGDRYAEHPHGEPESGHVEVRHAFRPDIHNDPAGRQLPQRHRLRQVRRGQSFGHGHRRNGHGAGGEQLFRHHLWLYGDPVREVRDRPGRSAELPGAARRSTAASTVDGAAPVRRSLSKGPFPAVGWSPVQAGGDGEPACRRDSVRPLRDGVAIHLSGLPGGGTRCRVPDGPPAPPVRPCSGWGLPSRPGHPGRWCALTAPFHPYLCVTRRRRHRRSVLCGTVLQVTPTGR